jgi:hypothetical protein
MARVIVYRHDQDVARELHKKQASKTDPPTQISPAAPVSSTTFLWAFRWSKPREEKTACASDRELYSHGHDDQTHKPRCCAAQEPARRTSPLPAMAACACAPATDLKIPTA